MQRVYGRKPSEIHALVEGFAAFMRLYHPQEVIDAIKKFVMKSPEVPTPSDLVDILGSREEDDFFIKVPPEDWKAAIEDAKVFCEDYLHWVKEKTTMIPNQAYDLAKKEFGYGIGEWRGGHPVEQIAEAMMNGDLPRKLSEYAEKGKRP
jgi:hypothetical protein